MFFSKTTHGHRWYQQQIRHSTPKKYWAQSQNPIPKKILKEQGKATHQQQKHGYNDARKGTIEERAELTLKDGEHISHDAPINLFLDKNGLWSFLLSFVPVKGACRKAFLHAFTGQPLPNDDDLRKENADSIPAEAKAIMKAMGLSEQDG